MGTAKLILVVSPHFDDAVLSCGDHAMHWCGRGLDVGVLTLFSRASATVSAELAGADPMSSHGESYMDMRRLEDCDALGLLGIRGKEGGLVDAGFRGSDQTLFAPPSRLRWQSIPRSDLELLEPAIAVLRPHATDATTVLLPLGIGGHVDHLIARQAGEALFHKRQIAYYADMPYAARVRQWSAAGLIALLRRSISHSCGSETKRQAVLAYKSQAHIVERVMPHLRELLLFNCGSHLDLRMPPAKLAGPKLSRERALRK